LSPAQKAISAYFDDNEGRFVHQEVLKLWIWQSLPYHRDTGIRYLPEGQSGKKSWPILTGRSSSSEGDAVTSG
jgi:hypothetical protein